MPAKAACLRHHTSPQDEFAVPSRLGSAAPQATRSLRCVKMSAGLARFPPPVSDKDGSRRKPAGKKHEIPLQINALTNSRYLLWFSAGPPNFAESFGLGCARLP
jgi:hypothetical protein